MRLTRPIDTPAINEWCDLKKGWTEKFFFFYLDNFDNEFLNKHENNLKDRKKSIMNMFFYV
jgi:hypothetical protein